MGVNTAVVLSSQVPLQGGLSSGYKKFIAENGIDDDSYSEEGLALFRVQGSGPENMQAIQVEPVSDFEFLFPKVYLTTFNIATSSLPVIYYLYSLFLGGLITEFIVLLRST